MSTGIAPNSFPPLPHAYNKSSVALIVLVPALGSFLFGYDIGSIGFVIIQIIQTEGISSALEGFTVAATTIGAFLGSVLAFPLSRRLDRREELRYGSLLYIVGAILEAVGAKSNFPTLITGRILYGLGIGFTMHAAPIYIGEMTPSHIRGPIVSLKEAAIVFGIVMGSLMGYLLDESVSHVFGLTLIVSVPAFLLSWQIPPSARWLILSGESEEAAKHALAFVYGEDAAEEELRSIQEAHERQPSSSATAGQSKSIFGKEYRPALIAGVGVIVLQQITGQPSVLSYATIIFRKAGISAVSSVYVGIFKLFATLLAVFFVESQGRKRLLYIGNTIMLIALIMLGSGFAGFDVNEIDETGFMTGRTIFILNAMFFYIGGYQCGFGPMGWVIVSEVFPLEVRGKAVAIAVQTNFALNAIVQILVPVLEEAIGLGWLFFIFAAVTAYSLWFVYREVPETKGLTLEEIEAEFKKRSGANLSNSNEMVIGEVKPIV